MDFDEEDEAEKAALDEAAKEVRESEQPEVGTGDPPAEAKPEGS